MGYQFFKRGVKDKNNFCLRINIPKQTYWILRIGVVGRCQKVQKFNFQSQFCVSKIIQTFSILFSLKNTNLAANFLLLTFFGNIVSKIILLLNWCPIFDNCHYTNSQNLLISFGSVDSQAKIFLILDPLLKNLTIYIAIIVHQGLVTAATSK